MKLVEAAQKEGFSFTVEIMFRHPQLPEMAARIKTISQELRRTSRSILRRFHGSSLASFRVKMNRAKEKIENTIGVKLSMSGS